MRGSVTVVIDVLRATTTMIHALAAGCLHVLTTAEICEARQLAESLPRSERLLAGERDGIPIPGFDCGNSPSEFVPERCCDRVGIFTTTNGTRAIRHASEARRLLLGAFVNFSALCQELASCDDPVHLLCAGCSGGVALEDTLLAGALVDFLVDQEDLELNDGARLAWDAYEQHGQILLSAMELSSGGQTLLRLGMGSDLFAAADVDRFGFVPEFDPSSARIVRGACHEGYRCYRGHVGPRPRR